MRESTGARSTSRLAAIPRWLRWLAVVLLVVLLLGFLLPRLLEERVRAYMEAEMNEALDDYTVTLADIDLRAFGLYLTLNDLVLRLDEHPEPPVAQVPTFRASLEWRQLLRGRLLADFLIDSPVFYLNMDQLMETVDPDPDDEDDWRDALEAVYFVDFNLIQLRDGELIFIGEDADQPLYVRNIQFRAEEIREAEEDDEYAFPSPFTLEAVVAEGGQVMLEGRANFLAEPQPQVSADFRVEQLGYQPVRPLLAPLGVIVNGGMLDGTGSFIYGIEPPELHIENITLSNLLLDYVLADLEVEEEAAPEEEEDLEAVETALEGPDPEVLQLYISHISVSGTVGFVHEAEDFRLFLEEAEMTLSNYSNHFLDGPAEATVTGLFMGSGDTRASATFRPEQEGPDFDIALEINETHLPSMNDLLRAYGDFDVQDGHFSFFTEFTINDGYIDGYMRPLFGDMEVYDGRDEDDGLLDQLYEMAVGAITTILENIPRGEVATQAEISGPLDDPDMSTWDIILGLIRNAFFQAILPGFESELEDA